MILLDTNAVIGLINRPSIEVRRRYAEALTHGILIAVSTIVIYELRYGIAKSSLRRLNASVLDGFLQGDVEVLPFEVEDASIAGDIRASLEAHGTPIGHYDILIAGQALRHDATLVTANTREFARVPGLKVEDWSAGP